MSAFETIRSYGVCIDTLAETFLTRESSDLYGMLRYFMGFTDERMQPAAHVAGKRFRPAILLFIADAFGCLEDAKPAALSIELFHNFSLIHDDIEDNDELRRGRPTVWKVWGVNKAINAGDAQLVLAFEALMLMPAQSSSYRQLEQFLMARYREVIEGQHLDFMLTDADIEDTTVSEQTYLAMLGKKSASLIGATTATAGYIAERPTAEVEALDRFGYAFGMAYQLHDDRQSLWAQAAETGKAVCGDIVERKKTLPIVYTRDSLSEAKRAQFINLYKDSTSSVEAILELIEETDARTYINEKIATYKATAFSALEETSLPREQKDILIAFGNTLVP